MSESLEGHPLLQQFALSWLGYAYSDTRKLLAVSGGADSVAMLRAMLSISPERLEVAHFNHRWRGNESDVDEDFVRSLCKQYEVPLHRAVAEESSSGLKKSEETARQDRYKFLEETAYRIGARCVVTAHTANDRAETLLHNLFRGTGLAGISSIKKTRNLGEDLLLVRPMLQVRREQVEDYLESLGQPFRQDSSNSNTNFKRNFIRKEVLPLVNQQYPDCIEKILGLADAAADADALIGRMACGYWDQVENLRDDKRAIGSQEVVVSFPSNELLPVEWPVLRAALVKEWDQHQWRIGKMTRGHWRSIEEMHAGGGEKLAVNLPGDLKMTWDSGWIAIGKIDR